MAEEVINSAMTEDIHNPIFPESEVKEDGPVPLTEDNIDEKKSFIDEADVLSTDSTKETDKPKTPDYLESDIDEEKDTDPETQDLQAMETYWKDDHTRKVFEGKYGENAKEEFEKMYKKALEKHRKETEDATEEAIVYSPVFADEDEGLTQAAIHVSAPDTSPGPIGGGRYEDGAIVGATKSVREANIASMRYLNDKEEWVEVENDYLDHINEDGRTSKDGRKIVAFEYIPFSPTDRTKGGMKAVYEGDRPTGEVASIHALNGWWTANIGLESNAKLPRAVGKAVVNTVADLAVGAVGVFNAIATIMDGDDDNAFIRSTRDTMTHFEMYKMSSSDFDQQNMFTVANGLDLTANIASQLLLGGAIGKIAASTSKLLLAGREGLAAKSAMKTLKHLRKIGAPKEEIAAAQKAAVAAKAAHAAKVGSKMKQIGNAQSAATITTLSLMSANEMRNEALNAGFSEDAAAGLFLATIPAMYQANKISELVINGDNSTYAKHIMRKVIRDQLKITPKKALNNPKTRWKIAQNISRSIDDQLAKVATTLSEGGAKGADLGMAAAAESFQEVTEQFVYDTMKTSANILAEIATPPGKDAPHMVGMYDAEYWESAPVEYMMNAVGGAMGGTMARFAFGRQHSNALAFKSSDHDKLLKMVMAGDKESLSIYENELDRARKNGSMGSDKYSYERGEDGKLKLMAELSPEERANTMSVAEANYRMRKLHLNQIKTIAGTYRGSYEQFVKKHPQMANLLNDTTYVQDKILKLHDDLETLYKDITPEAQEAAENMPPPEQPAPSSGEAVVAEDQAKEANKSTDANTQVVSNEKIDEPAESNQAEFTEYEQTYAGVLGVSPDKARQILEKEQEMKDVLSGKTAERDLIHTIVQNDPDRYGVLGSNPDEVYAHVENVLDSVITGDLDTHKELQTRRGDFIRKSQEFESAIDSLETIEDARALSDNVVDGEKQFFVSEEKMKFLSSKLKDMANDQVQDKDIEIITDILAEKLGITSEESSDELMLDLQNDADLEIDWTDEGSIKTWVDNNADKLLTLAKTQYVADLAKKGKSGVMEAIASPINANREQLMQIIAESMRIMGDLDAGPAALAQLSKDYSRFLKKGSGQLITEEEAEFPLIREPLELDRKFSTNRSELTVDEAGDGVDIMTRMLYPTKTGVETGEVTIEDDINRLIDQLNKSQTGIFTGIDEAREGLAAAKVRKAQLDLLFRLGDPYNDKALEDFTGAELINAAGTIATLRDLNSKVLTEEEFRASMADTKYAKFSKFISGWLFDPVKLRTLTLKGNSRTATEEAQYQEMITRLDHLGGLHKWMSEVAIPQYENLIKVGEESQDEGAVAKKFKQSSINYFNKLAGRVVKAGQDMNNTIIQSLGNDLMVITDNASADNDQDLRNAYDVYLDIAKEFYLLPDDVKKTFVQGKPGSSNNDLIAMTMADAGQFYKKYGNILNTIKDTNPDGFIMPSIDQEIASFEAYAFMNRPKNSALETMLKEDMDPSLVGFENFLWVPGSYGTGKTQVVFGMGIKAAQERMKEVDPDNNHKVVISSNNVDQVNNLHSVAKRFSINLKHEGLMTAEELLRDLTSHDAPERYKDVSVIAFDEATYLDYFQAQGDKKSTLTKLGEALEQINKAKDPGQPRITFMAIGDSKQGGWRENMETLDGDKVSESDTPSNISTLSDYVFSTKPLVTQFRSYVNEIDTFAGKLKKVSATAMADAISKRNSISSIGTFYNKADNQHLGCEINNTAKELYDADTLNYLKNRLADKDDDFTLLIVDEANNLPTEFQQLITEYGDHAVVMGVEDINTARHRSIKGAQGLEASYVIVNTPSTVEGWLPTLGSKSPESYKYDILSMLVGRARYFAKVRIDSSINISSEQSESVKEIKTSLAQFMNEWSTLRMSILDPDSIQTVEPQNPVEIDYKVGEQVSYTDAEGKVIETAVVSEMKEDGIVTFTGDKTGTVYEENYKSGETDLGTKFVRSSDNSKYQAPPTELNFVPGEEIAVYNMSEGLAQFGGRLIAGNAFVSRIYINDQGQRVAEVIAPDSQTPQTFDINIDEKIKASQNDPDTLARTASRFRRKGDSPVTVYDDINDDPKNTRENAYKRYAMDVHGTQGQYKGKQATLTKVEEGGTIEATDTDGNLVEIPYDALGKDLLITKIENRFKRDVLRQKGEEEIIHEEPPMGSVGSGDPTTLEWSDFQQTISELLGEEVYYEDIDGHINDIQIELENPNLTTDEKATKVEILNHLQGLKLIGSPDTPYTEEQLKVGNMLSSGVNNLTTNEDSQEYLKQMEVDGLGVTYGEYSTGNTGSRGPAVAKRGFSRNLFGIRDTDVPSEADIPGHTVAAFGLSEKGKDGMLDYKYSLVSYEYYFKRDIKNDDGTKMSIIDSDITHALVATLPNGQKMVLSVFPTQQLRDSDSKIAQILEPRRKALQKQSLKYKKDNEFLPTDDHVAVQKGHATFLARSEEDKRKTPHPPLIKDNTPGIYMETDITDAVLNGEVLIGATAGGLVTSSAYTRNEVISNPDVTSVDDEFVAGVPLQEGDVENSSISSLKDVMKEEINDTTAKDYNDLIFHGKGVMDYNGAKVVVLDVNTNRPIAFITEDGHAFRPFFGIDKNGNIIEDPDGTTIESDEDLKAAKALLEQVKLDMNMTAAPMETDEMKTFMSGIMRYSQVQVDAAVTKWAEFKKASDFVSKRLPKSFSNVRVKYSELKAMMQNREGLITMSNPLVFRQSIGEDTSIKAGVPFVLYSYNAQYDLSDPVVVRNLESEFVNFLTTADDSAIDQRLKETKNGIGIMLLDFESHSMSDLLGKFRDSNEEGKANFNRYVIPSGSAVNKRLLGFFTDIAHALQGHSRGEDSAYEPNNYTRLGALRKENTENGKPVRVLDDVKLRDFSEEVKKAVNGKSDKITPAVMAEIFSIIDTITNDLHMGHYVTERFDEYTVQNTHGNLFPGTSPQDFLSSLKGKTAFKRGETSGKPIVHGYDTSPIVFIPQSYTKKIEDGESYQPMKLNLEALFKMVEANRTSENTEAMDGAFAVFDELMQDLSLDRTLGLGIKVPPAVTSSNKTQLWYEFPVDSNLDEVTTTTVKDIKLPAGIFSIDGLAKALEPKAKKKPEPDLKAVTQKINTEAQAAFDGIVKQGLERISKVDPAKTKLVESRMNNVLDQLEKAYKAHQTKIHSIGGNSAELTTIYKQAEKLIREEVRKSKPVKEFTLDQIRDNKFPLPDQESLDESELASRGFTQKFKDSLSKLRYIVDAGEYESVKSALNALAKSSSNPKYFENYLKPIYAGIDPVKGSLSSRASIDAVMDSIAKGDVVPSPVEGDFVESVLASLEGLQDGIPFRPEDKTAILEAWNSGDANVKERLEPYLFADIENPSDPVVLKFALFEAFTSDYPVQLEGMQSLQQLKELNPEMHEQLMKNQDVEAGLTQVLPDNLVKIVNDFKADIDEVINGLTDTDEKLTFITALDKVVEGLTPILPESIINNMKEMTKVARDSVMNVRGQGDGPNLLGLIQNSPLYKSLSKDKPGKGHNLTQGDVDKIFTKIQEDVGKDITNLAKSLRGEEVTEEEKALIPAESLLFGNAVFKHVKSADQAELIAKIWSNPKEDPFC